MVKQKLINGDEVDVIARRGYWRSRHAYLQRPGAVSAVKTRLRRRARHEARQHIRAGDEW